MKTSVGVFLELQLTEIFGRSIPRTRFPQRMESRDIRSVKKHCTPATGDLAALLPRGTCERVTAEANDSSAEFLPPLVTDRAGNRQIGFSPRKIGFVEISISYEEKTIPRTAIEETDWVASKGTIR